MASEAVHFTNPNIDGTVMVDRLSRADLGNDMAVSMLSLATRSYAAQFEGLQAQAKLDKGVFNDYFQPSDPAGVANYRRRALSYMDKGSQYWLAQVRRADLEPEAPGELAGFIKVSPSRATPLQKARLAAPNLFVNDIVVDPSQQGQGVGADLFYTAMKYSGYREEARVALHAFGRNSRVNDWFANLTFEINPKVSVSPLELNFDDKLGQLQMEALTVSGVAQALEARYPHVKTASTA